MSMLDYSRTGSLASNVKAAIQPACSAKPTTPTAIIANAICTCMYMRTKRATTPVMPMSISLKEALP